MRIGVGELEPELSHDLGVFTPFIFRKRCKKRLFSFRKILIGQETCRAVHKPRRIAEVPAHHHIPYTCLAHSFELAVEKPWYGHVGNGGALVRTRRLDFRRKLPPGAAGGFRHGAERCGRAGNRQPVVTAAAGLAELFALRARLEIVLNLRAFGNVTGALVDPLSALRRRMRMIEPGDEPRLRITAPKSADKCFRHGFIQFPRFAFRAGGTGDFRFVKKRRGFAQARRRPLAADDVYHAGQARHGESHPRHLLLKLGEHRR